MKPAARGRRTELQVRRRPGGHTPPRATALNKAPITVSVKVPSDHPANAPDGPNPSVRSIAEVVPDTTRVGANRRAPRPRAAASTRPPEIQPTSPTPFDETAAAGVAAGSIRPSEIGSLNRPPASLTTVSTRHEPARSHAFQASTCAPLGSVANDSPDASKPGSSNVRACTRPPRSATTGSECKRPAESFQLSIQATVPCELPRPSASSSTWWPVPTLTARCARRGALVAVPSATMIPAGPTVEGAGGPAAAVHASTVWLPRSTVAPSVWGAAVFGVSRRAGRRAALVAGQLGPHRLRGGDARQQPVAGERDQLTDGRAGEPGEDEPWALWLAAGDLDQAGRAAARPQGRAGPDQQVEVVAVEGEVEDLLGIRDSHRRARPAVLAADRRIPLRGERAVLVEDVVPECRLAAGGERRLHRLHVQRVRPGHAERRLPARLGRRRDRQRQREREQR